MSRFLTISDDEMKRCAICQQRKAKASYFRGRYVCEDCLKFVKETI